MCGGCSDAVWENENALECEKYEKWFHTACEKIDKEMFEAIAKHICFAIASNISLQSP